MRKLMCLVVIVMMLTVLVPAPGGATIAMHQSLTAADVKISSYTANGGLGYQVAMLGDINGDGYGDYMGVDNYNDSFKGNAYLFYGRKASFPTSASQANTTFHAEAATAAIFNAVALGDVNGDGFNDFILGAPDLNKPIWDEGAAYIFFGGPGVFPKYVNASAAPAIIYGTNIGDIVGWSMAGIGDANGDGFDDFVIGCFGRDGWGVTYLFLGKPVGSPGWNQTMNVTHAAASFHGKEGKALSGKSLAGGDVNGDGLDDIVIGSPGSDFFFDNFKSPGYVYIVFGRTAGWAKDVDLSTNANASLKGEHYDDYAGQSVAVPGDVNGDGCEDILVGTHLNDEGGAQAGKAYIYLGRKTGWNLDTNLSGADASWRGEAANNQVGLTVSTAGDVNGDSLADFMIGGPRNSDQGLTMQGQTYLFLGKKPGWAKNQNINTADASWLGEMNNDNAPSSLAGKGDVNADGVGDILIGAQRIATQPGKMYLIFPVKNTRPTNITSVTLWSDAAMTKHATYPKLHDELFVKLKAQDADPANANVEQVRVKSNPHDATGFVLGLMETGANTGIFTGSFFVENFTQPDIRWIKALPICRVRAEAVMNTSAFDEVSVGGYMKIDSLTVMPGNAPTLYAMKAPYSIRVNVTDTLGANHISHVNLSMPIGTDHVNFTGWHGSNVFQTTFNPRFYLILDQASGASDPSENRTILTFKIYVNWTFPDGTYHAVMATAVSKDYDYSSKTSVDCYRVETQLDFYGSIKVTGNKNRQIKDGTALALGEKVTFTNVKVVYKGTTDVYPLNSQFEVFGLDSDGSHWYSPESSGAYINVVVEAPYYTYKSFNVTIDIGIVPHQCVNKTFKYSFPVDGDQIMFSNPTPVSTEWQINKRVNVRINISDTGGSMVNANSIEFRVKQNGGVWGGWTNAQLTGYFPTIEASVLADFKDGPSNLVQWRATDGVGNLDGTGNKTASLEYVVKVDTLPPVVSNVWPGPGNVSKFKNVNFGLRLTDTYSQVKGESIQYTVSTDDQNTWSNWTNASYSGSKPVFDCKANWTFLNGSKNWVRWKATDNVGNIVFSDSLQIIVNTTPPPPPNRKPVPQAIANKLIKVGSVLMFQVNATDPDNDPMTFSLTENTVGMVISNKGLFTFTPTKDQVGNHNVTVKVSDGKLNASVSFVVMVDLPLPVLTVSNVQDLQGLLKDKITVTGTATGGVQGIQTVQFCIDNGTWTTAGGTGSWSFILDTKALTNGQHKLSIRATDGIGTFATTDLDITVKNKKGGGGSEVDPMLLIGIVAVVGVVGGVVGLLLMKRKKGGTQTTLPPPDQTAQAPPPPQQPPK